MTMLTIMQALSQSCRRQTVALFAVAAIIISFTRGKEMNSYASASQTDQASLSWIATTDPRLSIHGLPFFKENGERWWRFPARAESCVADYIWNTSKAASGARLRLRSDTRSLAIRLTYAMEPGAGQATNSSLMGMAGIDCYVDGAYVSTIVPDPSTKSLQYEDFFFRGIEKRMRQITIYLPLFCEVSVESIGIDPDAALEPPAPFAIAKPAVFYGTSITHGGCAGRPGLSYEAMLARSLNIDFVNFGLNGCGRGERAVAEIISEVDASCFVLDFAQNNYDAKSYETAYRPFIKTLRARHPDTPIFCVTPIYWTPESKHAIRGSIHERMREVVRRAVRVCHDEGDKNVILVEGPNLLGPDKGDGLSDGLHPNTLGFWWMAQGLEPHLRAALGLPIGAK